MTVPARADHVELVGAPPLPWDDDLHGPGLGELLGLWDPADGPAPIPAAPASWSSPAPAATAPPMPELTIPVVDPEVAASLAELLDAADLPESVHVPHLAPMPQPWWSRSPYLFSRHEDGDRWTTADELGPDLSLDLRELITVDEKITVRPFLHHRRHVIELYSHDGPLIRCSTSRTQTGVPRKCSFRGCPVDASSWADSWAQRVQTGIMNSVSALAFSITVQHDDDPLAVQWDRLDQLHRQLRKGKLSRDGIIGYASVVQSPWSPSGWHAHRHGVLLLDRELSEDELHTFRSRWRDRLRTAAAKLGIELDHAHQYIEPVKSAVAYSRYMFFDHAAQLGQHTFRRSPFGYSAGDDDTAKATKRLQFHAVTPPRPTWSHYSTIGDLLDHIAAERPLRAIELLNEYLGAAKGRQVATGGVLAGTT